MNCKTCGVSIPGSNGPLFYGRIGGAGVQCDHCANQVVTADEAAKILGIPVIAMGQILFDGKVQLAPGHCFYKGEIQSLKNSAAEYVSSLR